MKKTCAKFDYVERRYNKFQGTRKLCSLLRVSLNRNSIKKLLTVVTSINRLKNYAWRKKIGDRVYIC